jgi:hypothetical protein
MRESLTAHRFTRTKIQMQAAKKFAIGFLMFGLFYAGWRILENKSALVRKVTNLDFSAQ